MPENIEDTTATAGCVPPQEQLVEQLRNGVVEVSFIKLNGERRVMECTLLPHMLPEPKKDHTTSQKKSREPDPLVVSVWDVNAQGWRAFRYERVENVQNSDYLERN